MTGWWMASRYSIADDVEGRYLGAKVADKSLNVESCRVNGTRGGRADYIWLPVEGFQYLHSGVRLAAEARIQWDRWKMDLITAQSEIAP